MKNMLPIIDTTYPRKGSKKEKERWKLASSGIRGQPFPSVVKRNEVGGKKSVKTSSGSRRRVRFAFWSPGVACLAIQFLVFLPAPFLDAAPFSCGEESGSISSDMQRAIALYDEGWGGSDVAVVEAIEVLEKLRPSPLVQAYYGSSCVAMARQVSDWQKRRWLKRAAKELDAAVKAAPEDLQVRLLRANTLAVLPRLAGRMDMAREDFDWLVARAEADPSPAPGCRQAIFYHAGAFALRNRDEQALSWLERAAAIESGESVSSERVHRMLQLAREQLPGKDG